MPKTTWIGFFLLLLLIACGDSVEIPTQFSTATKVDTEKKDNITEPLPETPRIGSIAELSKDKTCNKTGDILTYAETYRYHIYVCGDERDSKPKSMIVKTVVGNSYTALIDDNPSVSWGRSYLFSHGEFVIGIGRPSRRYASNFFVYVRFANESFIKEKILVYLFNERIIPNYRKVNLPPNKQANERFLKFLPTFSKQAPLCKSSKTSESIQPYSTEAYALSPNRYLVELTCFGSGYNRIYQYVLYSDGSIGQQAKIIPFVTLDPSLIESGKIQKTELPKISGRSDFFPEDNTLKIFHKGIGAGGCGYASEYKLIGEKFELQEFRKYDCANSQTAKTWQSKSPEEFPKIYP